VLCRCYVSEENGPIFPADGEGSSSAAKTRETAEAQVVTSGGQRRARRRPARAQGESARHLRRNGLHGKVDGRQRYGRQRGDGNVDEGKDGRDDDRQRKGNDQGTFSLPEKVPSPAVIRDEAGGVYTPSLKFAFFGFTLGKVTTDYPEW
jgi:hypothetical protein